MLDENVMKLQLRLMKFKMIFLKGANLNNFLYTLNFNFIFYILHFILHKRSYIKEILKNNIKNNSFEK